MKYTAVIEKTGNGYSAYLLDLPGCIAAGDTLDETADLIRQAAAYHVEMMAEDGEAIPEPTSAIVEVEVPVPAASEEVPSSPTGDRRTAAEGQPESPHR